MQVVFQEITESMFSEIVKMHQLSHPHLMNLIEVCLSDDSIPLIIMPYMENGSFVKLSEEGKDKPVGVWCG